MSERALGQATDAEGNAIEAPTLSAPHDPSQPVTTRPAEAAPAPAPAEEPVVPEKPAFVDQREAIAKRIQARRAAHDQQFTVGHKPPFIEHGEREAAAAAPAEDASAQPAPQTPPADAGFTLKVRGKDVHVASRDELLRLADVEPHEAADFTDDRLIRLAQKEMSANARIEEARSAQDKVRTADPAPVAPQPTQQQPAAEAKSLQDLRIDAINKTQLGTPEEAAEAWQAYENQSRAEEMSRRTEEGRWHSEQTALQNDLRSFAESNADITSNPVAQRLLYPTASEIMANDLRGLGISEDDLRPALSNPENMAQAYRHARLAGLRVRTNAEILAAAAAQVRTDLRMAPPVAPGQPQPNAANQRIDEKRTLQAQPTRSGHPIQEPSQGMDIDASRKAAIEKMRSARFAPNVPNGAMG